MDFFKNIATVFDQYPHMNNLLILIALLLGAFWLCWFIQEWRYAIKYKHSGAKNFEVKIAEQKQELIVVYEELKLADEKIKNLEGIIRSIKNILF